MNVNYDSDFSLWSEQQAALLRAGKVSELDLENIAEEIEALSRSDKRALRSHLAVLIQHIIKWNCQSNKCSKSWKKSILNSRQVIDELVQESPSLKPYLASIVEEAYRKAKAAALLDVEGDRKAEEAIAQMADTCPFSEQILGSTEVAMPVAT
jgi:hypothetical protein